MIKKKWFLYLTEFFSGMSVMAVELGASRLLAPYFSSSQIVWTIIIGTIMIAMALGNVIGGRLADKKPNPDRLYLLLVIAAVWIVGIPFLGKYIIAGISLILATFVTHNFLVWASFASCMIVFVFPLLLLGMVTPTLCKLSMKDLDDNGKTVGELGALNTIGSIIGTFLPTFVTIPTVGTAVTFIIFAAILFILGAVYFISVRRKLIKCTVCFVIGVAMGIFATQSGFAFFEENVYEGESIYNYLRVEETDTQVIFSTNVLFGVQSVKMKTDEISGMYFEYAMASPMMADVYNKEECDILVLGLGTGTFPTNCCKYFPNANVTGVEIDGAIVDLAKEYFDLPEKVNAVVADGRAYLSEAGQYDVIMVDAFQDITIPFQMSTVEFFTLVKDHLKEDGVMIVNLNMNSDKEGSINQYLCDTIMNVFEYGYLFNIPTSSNRIVYASQKDEMITNLANNLPNCENEDLVKILNNVVTRSTPMEKGDLILTDDKAPVELLGMEVLDDMIAFQLSYYRNKFSQMSFQEILDYIS